MNILIIGASAAGISAAETLRKLDKNCNITILTKENCNRPYSKSLLAYLFSNRIDLNKIYFKPKNFFEKYNLTYFNNEEVIEIDRKNKFIKTKNNKKLNYDKLLLATGSKSFIPEINNISLNNIFTFNEYQNYQDIKKNLNNAKNIVVLGAGFVGLEIAYALNNLGFDVSIVEKCSQILPNQMDNTGSYFIQKELENKGIKFFLNQSIIEIEGSKNISNVILSDKTRLKSNMLIICSGVIPNKEIAKNADLETKKGLVVDEYLTTSDNNIYGAGDIIELYDITTKSSNCSGSWANAVIQGQYAAYNILGYKKRYKNFIAVQNSIQFYNVAATSNGKVHIDLSDDQSNYEVLSIKEKNYYKKIVLRDNKIIGFILINKINQAGLLSALIKLQLDISEYKEKLLYDDFTYSYFIDEKFEQYNAYAEIPDCWKYNEWYLERKFCAGI
ncbi:MAG TPA: FAD-dependent oxidoreductase [bacterium]|nr:FAD-dependent oxidoreductase [bacterium]